MSLLFTHTHMILLFFLKSSSSRVPPRQASPKPRPIKPFQHFILEHHNVVHRAFFKNNNLSRWIFILQFSVHAALTPFKQTVPFRNKTSPFALLPLFLADRRGNPVHGKDNEFHHGARAATTDGRALGRRSSRYLTYFSPLRVLLFAHRQSRKIDFPRENRI